MCADFKSGVTRAQIIGFAIPIVISLLGLVWGLYQNHESRIQSNENDIKIIKFEVSSQQRDIDIMKSDLKQIKELVIGIDKKVDVNEAKWSHAKKK